MWLLLFRVKFGLIWSNLVEIGGFEILEKKVTPRSENFRRNTPIIAKIPAAKNPITKKQVKSKEVRHPCGPAL